MFDPGQGKTPRTSLVFGNQKINVRPRDADKVEWFTADHETAGSDDLCFLTSSTPEQVVAHLKANGVAIEEGPVAKQGARGTLRSVYCRDPDGSLIEISSYEEMRLAIRRHSGMCVSTRLGSQDSGLDASHRPGMTWPRFDAHDPVAELLPAKQQAAAKAAREDK